MTIDEIQKNLDRGISIEEQAAAISSMFGRGVYPESAHLKPEDFSDAGNAEVFESIYGADLAYCDALGWLYWNGTHWERNDHKPTELAIAYTRGMLEDARAKFSESQEAFTQAQAALLQGDSDKTDTEKEKAALDAAKKYYAHAAKSRNLAHIKAMCELAKPDLLHHASEFDAEPHILNTPAGIIDLKTGEMHPNTPQAKCSKITAVSPDSVNAEIWEKFLDTITCGDGPLRGYLQMLAGMALVGKVYQEGMMIAYGNGANGKSTFFNALGAVMGDYFGTIDVDVLTTKEQNKGAALATLRGKRLVVAGELEEFQRLSPATVKRICSTDAFIAEEKYKPPESILPSHTVCLFTNFMPRVSSTDDGIWRRLFVLPFRAKIVGNSDIKNYGAYLVETCGGAILQWAIDGAVMFCRNGHKITAPDIVAEATEEYQQRENWLDNFLTDCCVFEPNAKVTGGDLLKAYKQWAKENGEYEGRRGNEIYSAMIAAGYVQTKPRNIKTWLGVRLKEDFLPRLYGNYYV